jgi:predicted ester cyclase
MSIEDNKVLSRCYIEVMHNTKNLALVDEVFARDCVIHLSGEMINRDGYRRLVQTFFTAVPDLHVTVDVQMADGDKVATHWTARGTQTGPFQRLAPTNNPVTVTGICIDRIHAIWIVESWMSYDLLSMMEQVGLMWVPGQADRQER